MIDLKHPGQRYLRCAGSLGWGFPAAIGVKCALPDRPVVCFTGDGGFYYHIAELETAARYGINLVIVVNNNSALNQEIPLIRRSLWRQAARPRRGDVALPAIDFAKVAEAFGCAGIRADRRRELNGALRHALTLNRPVVIDAITDVERAGAPRLGSQEAY